VRRTEAGQKMGRSVENRAGGGRALTGWTPVLARQKSARGIMLFISDVIEEAKGGRRTRLETKSTRSGRFGHVESVHIDFLEVG